MPQNSDKPRDNSEIVQFKLRIREELRAKIEVAATASGNSMNSEIAERLLLSLHDENLLSGTRTRRLLHDIARQISRAEDQTGKKWDEDLATMIAAERLIADALRRARPTSDIVDELKSIRGDMGALAPRYGELRQMLTSCGAIEPESSLAKFFGPLASSSDALPETHWHQPDQPSKPLSEEGVAGVRDLLSEWQEIHSLHQRIAIAEAKAAKDHNAKLSRAEAEGEAIYEAITGKREVEHGS